jgi:hypothetical protein
MTYYQASDILDQRRAGANMPKEVIDKALELTGDLDPTYSIADAMRELTEAV